jgi:hypothetical protein
MPEPPAIDLRDYIGQSATSGTIRLEIGLLGLGLSPA